MTNRKIVPENDVKSYLKKLRYALDNGAIISIEENRKSEKTKKKEFTNRFYLDLISLNNPKGKVQFIKKTIYDLVSQDYIGTVVDDLYTNRELYEFIKIIKEKPIYIKLRVELLNAQIQNHYIIVLSFHISELDLKHIYFPYKHKEHHNENH